MSFTLWDGVVATRAPRPTNYRGTEGTMAQNIAIERGEHLGVRVRNLDRALGFYRVLGFAVVRRAEGDDVAIIRNEHGVELRRASLLVVGLIGAALLYGDGVITPAISVLSAIEGLKIDAPGLAPMVVPITIAILASLFLIQRRGTEFIGSIFGPVMLVWFVAIGLLRLL